MQEYILELCSELKQSIADKNITFSVCVEAIMPLKEAVYIGLIINELVSNSIKYAFEGDNGEIYIELQNHHDRFKLVISDSGKGYKKESIKESSLGLKLVESLVKRQLKGKISNKIEEDIFKYEIEF